MLNKLLLLRLERRLGHSNSTESRRGEAGNGLKESQQSPCAARTQVCLDEKKKEFNFTSLIYRRTLEMQINEQRARINQLRDPEVQSFERQFMKDQIDVCVFLSPAKLSQQKELHSEQERKRVQKEKEKELWRENVRISELRANEVVCALLKKTMFLSIASQKES